MRDSLPVGASVPALGLSNKAVFEGERLNAGFLFLQVAFVKY